jgi:hypothetical protein
MAGPAFRLPGPVCQGKYPQDSGMSSLAPGPSSSSLGCPTAGVGPQSFASARPGTEMIDPCVLAANRALEQRMLTAADTYYEQQDFRWFFAYAHGKITEQINENVSAFQRPNALLRLNIHFAHEFLKAICGEPHAPWKKAFSVCKAFEKGSGRTAFLVGEIELCGAAMANVHIHVDLAAAIRDVGCIPPSDYSNMLLFVNRGAREAVVRLRGKVIGIAETILNRLTAPLVDLEVKAWRNAVYDHACHARVHAVETDFVRRVK